MSLTLIHSRLANSVILYLIVMMLWAFWLYLGKKGLSPSFRGALIISSVLILLQGVIGGVLWLNSNRPDESSMHLLYGIIGVLGIPGIYVFGTTRQDRYPILVIGIGILLLLAIIFRSVATG